MILLKEEGLARGRWPMARVVKVHPSQDGLVRTVSLRVGESVFERPVNKTVVLVEAGGST